MTLQTGGLLIKNSRDWRFHSIAKLRAQMFNPVLADRGVYSMDCHNENGCTADCQRQESKVESGLLQARTVRLVLIRSERVGWQSVVSLRADCQLCITVVANRGRRKSSPAIFTSRDLLFKTSHIFKHDFKNKTNTQRWAVCYLVPLIANPLIAD
jgi:hypothetical protein